MRASTAVLCSVLLAAALSSGCDPHTISRVINATAEPIEIEVVLDKTQWRFGFQPEEYERFLAEMTDEQIREKLEVYALQSERVELVAVDADRFAGTYQVAPSGVMILFEGLGSGPYLHISELAVTKGDKTSTFANEQEVLELFRRVEGNLFEFRITDSF